jgi:hypothetical protein
MNWKTPLAALLGALAAVATLVYADGYKDTAILPGTKWHVHDPDRPKPKIIDPGTASTPDTPGKPPSDAVVLFDGTSTDAWQLGNGKPCPWPIVDGAMMTTVGDCFTKQKFGDLQLHVEFKEPSRVEGNGQGRGNSGVFLHATNPGQMYEIQVLDNYNNPTYADGQCAALYGQWPPLVNACRPPGVWQTYDIVWQSPRWAEGDKPDTPSTPAYVTVLHNGIVVQNHIQAMGYTNHRQPQPNYHKQPVEASIGLQYHHNPVGFRNVWVRKLGVVDQVDDATPAAPAAPAAAPAAK